MKCEEILPLIQGHLDGELAESDEQRLRRHLAQCPFCSATLTSYRRLDEVLGRLPKVEPPYPILEQLDLGSISKGRPAGQHVFCNRQNLLSRKSHKVMGSLALISLLIAFLILTVVNGEKQELAGELPEGEFSIRMESTGAGGGDRLAPLDPPDVASNFDTAQVQPLEEGRTHPSPNGKHTAHLGPDRAEIRIYQQADGGEEIQFTWSIGDSTWTVERVLWLSEHQLYSVLVHQDGGMRQYWLLDAQLKEAVQLPGPHPAESSPGTVQPSQSDEKVN